MKNEDYGLQAEYDLAADIPKRLLILPETLFSEITNSFAYNLNWHGDWIIGIEYDTNQTAFIFLDDKWKTLSRKFIFNEDFSNQRFHKVLKRAIKRYFNLLVEAPAVDKSSYVKRVKALFETLC